MRASSPPRPTGFCPTDSFRPRISPPDRKSTRLNSSHGYISYAVFCLKKKKKMTPNGVVSTIAGTLTVTASGIANWQGPLHVEHTTDPNGHHVNITTRRRLLPDNNGLI